MPRRDLYLQLLEQFVQFAGEMNGSVVQGGQPNVQVEEYSFEAMFLR